MSGSTGVNSKQKLKHSYSLSDEALCPDIHNKNCSSCLASSLPSCVGYMLHDTCPGVTTFPLPCLVGQHLTSFPCSRIQLQQYISQIRPTTGINKILIHRVSPGLYTNCVKMYFTFMNCTFEIMCVIDESQPPRIISYWTFISACLSYARPFQCYTFPVLFVSSAMPFSPCYSDIARISLMDVPSKCYLCDINPN